LGPFDIVVLFFSTQAFLVLGLHAVFKTVQEEAEHEKGDSSQPQTLRRVVLQDFRSILAQRDIVYVVLVISALAGIAWAVNVAVIFDQIVQVWAFSLALIEALVLFFAIEVLYLLSWKRLPAALKKSQFFRRAVDIATLGGALVFSLSSATGCMFSIDLSCSAFGWLGDLVFGTFFVAFFISGLGELSVADTISDTVSSHVPLGRKVHFLYIGLLLSSMAALSVFAGIGFYFGPGTGYVTLGAEFAAGFGVVYLVYLLIRRQESEHFSTLVYAVLILGISGLFFAYSFRNIVPASLGFTGVAVESPVDLVLPLTLFTVGYLSLALHLPKSAERRLGIRHDRLVACLTFLLIFSVVANYQRALFAGVGTAVFLFQRDVPVGLGLWAGAILFAIGKVKWAGERGKVKPKRVSPHCGKCRQALQPTSKYCWKCGSSDLKTEKVLFAGDAKQILDVQDHHSARRKIVSLLAGGPLGFLAFGMDIRRKSGPKGQIIVTDNAAYFSGKTYPLDEIVNVKPGHYSNSVVLDIREPVNTTAQKLGIGSKAHHLLEVELKTSNPVALSRTIRRASPLALQPSAVERNVV